MKADRLTRVNESLRRGIGEILFRVIREGSVDLSGVTITHVIASSDMKTARVLVSVRDPAQRPVALAAIERHRPEIQRALGKTVILKYTPRLHFHLDTSIEEGDRVLTLLNRLEPRPQDEDPAGPAAPDGDAGHEPDADQP